MVHVSVSVWFGLDGPSVTVLQGQAGLAVFEGRHLVLHHNGDEIAVDTKIIVVFQQFSRQGVCVTGSHDHQRDADVRSSCIETGQVLHGLNVLDVSGEVALVGTKVRFQRQLDARVPQPLSESSRHQHKDRTRARLETGLFGFGKRHSPVSVVAERLTLRYDGLVLVEWVDTIGRLLEQDFGFAEVGWQASGVGGVQIGELYRQRRLGVGIPTTAGHLSNFRTCSASRCFPSSSIPNGGQSP